MSTPALDPRVARTRAAVLDAVGRLLVEGGLAAVTVEAVMARTGAARATVYRHWATRDDLVLAGLEHLMPPPRADGIPDAAVEVALPAIVAGFAAQLAGEPWAVALPVLLDAARRDPRLRARMDTFLAQRKHPVRQVLVRAVEAGELRPDLDPDVAVSQLLGPLMFRRIISAEPLDEAVVDAVAGDFLRANRPAAAPGG